MAESKLSPGESVMGSVYRYLRDNKDVMIHLSDLRADMPHLNTTSIDSAINRIVRIPSYGVERGEIKGTYIYHSGKAKATESVSEKPVLIDAAKRLVAANPLIAPKRLSPQVYERVGRLNDLADILRDEQERLYVAMPLDTYINGKPAAH
jgi:hypothetical protein